MINKPSVKPNEKNPPWNEPQLDPGPIVDPLTFPQISMRDGEIKSKCQPKPMNSRIMRIGRKLGSKQGEK